jgi:hypothetical protein
MAESFADIAVRAEKLLASWGWRGGGDLLSVEQATQLAQAVRDLAILLRDQDQDANRPARPASERTG